MAGAIGVRVSIDDDPAVLIVKGRKAILKNAGPQEVYLGGSGVTAAAGFDLASGGQLEVDATVDGVYGICATGETAIVHVLATRSPKDV